jgi:hypothetical protein
MKLLSNKQRVLAVITGVVLWFAFVWVIRAIPWALDGGMRSAILFVVVIPMMWVLLKICQWAIALTQETLFEGIVLATTTALLVDGLVFTFVSHWYGNTETTVRLAAAVIIWGAAVLMCLAWRKHQHYFNT